jgi:glycosyltransferase involved in cell wall biosynthesis
MTTFSIIIATKDRAALLDGALTSLANQVDAPPLEIIVVDNGSTDDTQVVAASHPVLYVYEPMPNRGLARNRGLALATGSHVLFIDDDVVLPSHFLAAHARAHARAIVPHVVSGPIINVPAADVRPQPTAANFSNAFFCTCNVSVPLEPLRAVGGFDESFDLYGWEDTELGVRLRNRDVRRTFAWDAYLWHIKPPTTETISAALGKTIEKARMAARFVRKDPSRRARLATGAYTANLLLGRTLGPRALQPFLAGIATSERAPAIVRSIARARLLDSVYVDELTRALADEADR